MLQDGGYGDEEKEFLDVAEVCMAYGDILEMEVQGENRLVGPVPEGRTIGREVVIDCRRNQLGIGEEPIGEGEQVKSGHGFSIQDVRVHCGGINLDVEPVYMEHQLRHLLRRDEHIRGTGEDERKEVRTSRVLAQHVSTKNVSMAKADTYPK